MENIFGTLKSYAGKWSLKSSRGFSDAEKAMVKSAVVVESQYGNSVCFHMNAGNIMFIPLSSNSTVGVGEPVDLDKARIITLQKEGEADIQRVEI